MKFFIPVFIITLFITGIACTSSQYEEFDEAAWIEEVDSWHEERIERLEQNDSWLTLAGFFWLEEGVNTFGSGENNDLRFDFEEAPVRIGSIIVKENTIHVNIEEDADVTVDGIAVQEALIYSEEMDNPAVMEWGSLNWYVIKRSGGYAIRLRDREHPLLSRFNGIDRYPVDPEWRISSEFIAFDTPIKLNIPNYIGEPAEETILGVLEFEIDNETYHIYPVADNLEERFFVIFADNTNSTKTYSGGRFVYTDPPDENNIVIIDFNKAYNPPCVFSEFATCPLPPPENRLPLAVEAGELRFDI